MNYVPPSPRSPLPYSNSCTLDEEMKSHQLPTHFLNVQQCLASVTRDLRTRKLSVVILGARTETQKHECKRRMARGQVLPSLPASCHPSSPLVSRAGSPDTVITQVIAGIGFIHLAALERPGDALSGVRRVCTHCCYSCHQCCLSLPSPRS